jgi:branched-chain amino acid transport system ATP-binding protein
VAASPLGSEPGPFVGAAGAGDTALAVRDLQVAYGEFIAVERATFSVKVGHCVAMIGPNGNGKSSIATAVAGLIASKGHVELFGQVAPRGDAVWAVQRGLVLVPERRRLFPQMTVYDNILLGCYGWTQSLRRAQRDATTEEAIALFPELRSRLKQIAGTLSGGQQQMTALARGLAARPRALIIDEPCLGLAEVVARRVYAALGELKKQGRTVILIEENPVRALEICDEVIRVERGIAYEAAKPPVPPRGDPNQAVAR